MKTIEFDEFTLTYSDNLEVQKAVFDKLISWYMEYELFSGESIMQNDDGQIYAPVLLSDIADDIIKFDANWKDDQ